MGREERKCIRLARQFSHHMEEYRERVFTYVLFQSPTRSVAAHLERYLLHMYYTSQLENLHDNREIDQLELDWITWQRDYVQKRGVIVEQVYSKQCNVNCKFLIYITNIKYLTFLYIYTCATPYSISLSV